MSKKKLRQETDLASELALIDALSITEDQEPAGGEREPQYLKPLKGKPKSRPFVTFDIESKDDDTQYAGMTRVFQVGFYDGKTYRSFRNSPEVAKIHWYFRAVSRGGCLDLFMRFVLGLDIKGPSPYGGFDCYAHNLGSFDGLFLPAWLERNNQSVSYKIMPVQSRIQAFEIWKHNPRRFRGNADAIVQANKKDREEHGVIRFLDSFRILPNALDKLAKSFELEGKLLDKNDPRWKKIQIPNSDKLAPFDLNTDEHDPRWELYNEADNIQLYQILGKYNDLILDTLGGEVGITAPSSAVKLLRRKYLPEDGPRIHRNIHFKSCLTDRHCLGCAHEFFRAAYFGGRTEIYMRILKGFYYDVNSSYPYSMTMPMPIGEMTELGENEDFSQYAANDNYIGFIRCTVFIPEDTYLPPLPRQMDGKLKFPTGRFSGTWDWVELRALGRIGGRILHVEKSVWIKGERFLDQYVRDMYKLKQKPKEGQPNPHYKGPALAEVAKLMMNSTFGKFGMEHQRQEIIILKPGEDEPTGDGAPRYPGESEEHMHKRRKAEKHGDQSFRIVTPLPGEPDEHFELRKLREQRGDFTQRWQLPELSMNSGIYEHDSLIRIRDTRVDADYIIPQIAAHITALSRVLLWSYSMEILETCSVCKTSAYKHTFHTGIPVLGHNSTVGGNLEKKCDKFVGHRIGYSDTDSIITDYGDFPDAVELGGLKKEYSEEITIEAIRPKMYRLTKATPFEGEHVRRLKRDDEIGYIDKKKLRLCLDHCPGCKKEGKKYLPGQHALDDQGQKKCLEECPGCSFTKVMMKGVPKDDRTEETLEKLKRGETITYRQHEKLGALAKRGFRDTPRMQKISKAMKSEYDKRYMDQDGNTKPKYIDHPEALSEPFKTSLLAQAKTPLWLISVVEREHPLYHNNQRN